jgi:hypothetical protein
MRAIRNNLGFHYRPARHFQDLRDHQIEDQVEFYQKMLAHPEEFERIHSSDESRFILGMTSNGSGTGETKKISQRHLQSENFPHQ